MLGLNAVESASEGAPVLVVLTCTIGLPAEQRSTRKRLPAALSSVCTRSSPLDAKATRHPLLLVACGSAVEKPAPSKGSGPNPAGRSTSAVEPSGTAAAGRAKAKAPISPARH